MTLELLPCALFLSQPSSLSLNDPIKYPIKTRFKTGVGIHKVQQRPCRINTLAFFTAILSGYEPEGRQFESVRAHQSAPNQPACVTVGVLNLRSSEPLRHEGVW
jgi:hypothetical protein